TPLGERHITADESRLSVGRLTSIRQEVEVRSSTTLPGNGAMFVSPYDAPAWDDTTRSSARSETSLPLQIHVIARSHDSITFDYESKMPVHFAHVHWIVNGERLIGECRLNGATRGCATVHNMHFVWKGTEINEGFLMRNTRVL